MKMVLVTRLFVIQTKVVNIFWGHGEHEWPYIFRVQYSIVTTDWYSEYTIINLDYI